ncbi:PREDICTED: probable E3 ubiquitin-protein ligase RHC2A [Lupinus angustifolius]|nr:PREDICTED: probable E3 ubiquitin-protein ligase RHC2A [Lupinus angustifolius]
MPFEFNVEVSTIPFDENDEAIYQSLAQVHMGDFFSIKIHVTNRIICLTREELQQPLSRIPYFESSYETTGLLACPQFLESGLVSVFPDNIIPPLLLHTITPHVMTFARDLCESGGETRACCMFNLVLDIVVEKLYDDVVNMMIEESAREVRTVPASKAAIESLKKVNLEKGMTKESCSVCLEELIEEEEVLAMPCKHMYHQECITNWLQRCDTCPLCRFSMNKSST